MAWGALLLSLSSSVTAPASFATLFQPSGPVHLHYRARLVDRSGRPHRIEVWRHDDAQLRRRLDDKVELFARRHGDDLTLTVHDLERDRIYAPGPQELLAMGRAMHWTELAYALQLPAAGELVPGRVVHSRLPAAPTCQAYTAGAGRARFSFCWSPALKLPLTVRDGRGRVVFQVEEVSLDPLERQSYTAPDTAPEAD